MFASADKQVNCFRTYRQPVPWTLRKEIHGSQGCCTLNPLSLEEFDSATSVKRVHYSLLEPTVLGTIKQMVSRDF